MTYKVLKSLVYGGIAYVEGQEVDIIEKSVAENCIERDLIAEITDIETSNAKVTGETDSTEITEDNEDATEEVVSSETSEENAEEPTKTNKRNKK